MYKMIKTIKSEADYHAALQEIERLMGLDPEVNSPDGEYFNILTLLVADYESKKYSVPLPDPINAVKFRMEQKGLTQRDLVPYIGSRSKVSEILSRKRPLTLSMIRALHTNLGIPAKVLLQEKCETNESSIDWDRFPLDEMIKRGWFKGSLFKKSDQAEKILRPFFAELGSATPIAMLYRRTDHTRSARSMDIYALTAWTARVMIRALKDPPTIAYIPGNINLEFMRHTVQLSWSDIGPLLAREFLKKHGISLVIEPHLPRTNLDGAAIMIQLDRPLIGLTLRYDRVDNFWFCLMHELAHISRHMQEGITQFYDDLDLQDQSDQFEREADEFASEALIPRQMWKKSPASRLRSPEAAEHLAKQLSIHPAIVAGRMRHEFKAYRLLNHLVGHGQVRQLFHEIDWSQ